MDISEWVELQSTLHSREKHYCLGYKRTVCPLFSPINLNLNLIVLKRFLFKKSTHKNILLFRMLDPKPKAQNLLWLWQFPYLQTNREGKLDFCSIRYLSVVLKAWQLRICLHFLLVQEHWIFWKRGRSLILQTGFPRKPLRRIWRQGLLHQ